jgi:hypothetical protein
LTAADRVRLPIAFAGHVTGRDDGAEDTAAFGLQLYNDERKGK